MRFATTAFVLLACQAQAQESDPGSIVRTYIAYGGTSRDELRTAGPASDPNNWLTAADVPESIRAEAAGKVAGAWHQNTLAQIGLDLTVEADDRVSDCRGTFGRTDLAPQLCTLLRQRGKFLHALTLDGVAVRREASITVQYSLNGANSNVGLPPAPPGPPWPVFSYSDGVTIASEPEWRRFARNRDGRSTAVSVAFRNGTIADCQVIKPSGSGKLDKAACAAAQTGKYNADPADRYQSLPMLVSWSRDGATVRLPVRKKWERAAAGSDLIVRGVKGAPAAASLDISETGAVTRCRVAQSSGSDEADMAMCRAMLATRFQPARDVFDGPMAGGIRAEVRFE
ncbi:TonB family protein [Sphingomonas koreensis]